MMDTATAATAAVRAGLPQRRGPGHAPVSTRCCPDPDAVIAAHQPDPLAVTRCHDKLTRKRTAQMSAAEKEARLQRMKTGAQTHEVLIGSQLLSTRA